MNEGIFEFSEVRSQKVCLATFQLISQLHEPPLQTEARVVDDLHHLGAQLGVIGEQVQGLEGGADDGKVVQAVFQARIGNGEGKVVGKLRDDVGVLELTVRRDEGVEPVIGGEALEQDNDAIVARTGHAAVP